MFVIGICKDILKFQSFKMLFNILIIKAVKIVRSVNIVRSLINYNCYRRLGHCLVITHASTSLVNIIIPFQTRCISI